MRIVRSYTDGCTKKLPGDAIANPHMRIITPHVADLAHLMLRLLHLPWGEMAEPRRRETSTAHPVPERVTAHNHN